MESCTINRRKYKPQYFYVKVCPICGDIFQQYKNETNQKTCCSVKCEGVRKSRLDIVPGGFAKGQVPYNKGVPCSEDKKRKVSIGVKKAWEEGRLKNERPIQYEIKECPICNNGFEVVFGRLYRPECCSQECAVKLRQQRGIIGGQFEKGFEPWNKDGTWDELLGIEQAMKSRIKSSSTRQGISVDEWEEFSAPIRRLDMNTKEYKDWRKAVFIRDNFVCRQCGAAKEIQAHHINSWSEFPDLRYDVDNGLTLCKECHMELHGLNKKEEREVS